MKLVNNFWNLLFQRLSSDLVFLNLPRVILIVCSITVSFGTSGFEFPFSDSASPSASTSSICIGSASPWVVDWVEGEETNFSTNWVIPALLVSVAGLEVTLEGPASLPVASLPSLSLEDELDDAISSDSGWTLGDFLGLTWTWLALPPRLWIRNEYEYDRPRIEYF